MFDASLCSYCCQTNFLTETIKLYCTLPTKKKYTCNWDVYTDAHSTHTGMCNLQSLSKTKRQMGITAVALINNEVQFEIYWHTHAKTAKYPSETECILVRQDKQWQTLVVANKVLTCETRCHRPQHGHHPYQIPTIPPCLDAMPTVEINGTTVNPWALILSLSLSFSLSPPPFFPIFCAWIHRLTLVRFLYTEPFFLHVTCNLLLPLKQLLLFMNQPENAVEPLFSARFSSVPWPMVYSEGHQEQLMDRVVRGTSGMTQYRSSSSPFCGRPLCAVQAWAGTSTL